MTLGIGAGQMNRVGSAKIALEQAGEKAKGAALHQMPFSQWMIRSKRQQRLELQRLSNQVVPLKMQIPSKKRMNMELRWYLQQFVILNIKINGSCSGNECFCNWPRWS